MVGPLLEELFFAASLIIDAFLILIKLSLKIISLTNPDAYGICPPPKFYPNLNLTQSDIRTFDGGHCISRVTTGWISGYVRCPIFFV